MAADEELESATEGPALIQVARKWARRRSPEVLRALAWRLTRTELGSPSHEVLVELLEEAGPAVAPLVLEVLGPQHDEDARAGLLRVLAGCGARDERILAVLLEQLREEPLLAANNLVFYGDPGALAALGRLLEDYPLANDVMDVLAQQTVRELAAAILDLGGTLSEAQHAKAEQAWRWSEPLRLALGRLGAKPGRNEPCWCGSGVKYKACHLGEDA